MYVKQGDLFCQGELMFKEAISHETTTIIPRRGTIASWESNTSFTVAISLSVFHVISHSKNIFK